MQSTPLLDSAGRRRSPATASSFHVGRTPRNKGLQYPPDPPTVPEIVAVMRAAGEGPEGVRLRGIIVVLWRAGLVAFEHHPAVLARDRSTLADRSVQPQSGDERLPQRPRNCLGVRVGLEASCAHRWKSA